MPPVGSIFRAVGFALVMIGVRADPPASVSLKEGATTAVLTNRSSVLPVFFRALRPGTSPRSWTVDAVLSNASPERVTGRVWVGFADRSAAAQQIQGTVAAGEVLLLEVTAKLPPNGLAAGASVSLGRVVFGDATGTPNWRAAVFVPSPVIPGGLNRLVYTRVLDDLGLPLEGGEVVEVGPVAPKVRAVGRGGWITLPRSPEVIGWEFHALGREPVFRSAPTGAASEVGLITVRLPQSSKDPARVLTPQTLPGLLPRGWSPLLVRDFGGGDLEAELGTQLPVGTPLVLTRWETNGWVWQVTGRSAIDVDGRARFVGRSAGRVAVVVADLGFNPALTEGALLPEMAGIDPTALLAEGRVDPASRPASREVRDVVTQGVVEFRAADGKTRLVSGLSLLCDIRETYVLKNGTRRMLPRYCAHITGFARPGTDGVLRANFPLRPTQLLGNEELSEALVHVDVLAPGAVGAGRLSVTGGAVLDAGASLRAAPGVLSEDQWTEFTTLPATDLSGVFPGTNPILLAAEISVAGLVAGRSLELELPRQSPNQFWVLGRAVFDAGIFGFEPVARLVSDAAGNVRVAEPVTGERLLGIHSSGLYLVVQVDGPQGLVSGVARDRNGKLGGGFLVRSGPWLSVTDTEGVFRAVAPVGSQSISAADPISGDSVVAGVVIPPGTEGLGGKVGVDLNTGTLGLRVETVDPAADAVRVPRIVTVTVRFNQPVNPLGLVQGGLTLVDAQGVVVPTSLSLGARNDTAQLRPTAELAPSTRFQVRLAAGIQSASGRALEGPREFSFTTQSDALVRGVAGRVTIYEPGATNVPAALLARIPAYRPAVERQGVVIHGTLGSAEPETPVILVNESTGETATVLSAPDGSFVSFIRATVDDFVSALVQNSNGTRNTIPASAQRFDDGSVALYRGGGVIDAAGEENGLQLLVDSGLIAGKTKFRLESESVSNVLARVGNQAPVGGRILKGFRYQESGDALNNSVDLSFPVRTADLGLAAGVAPTNGTFALVIPRKIDGVVVYDLIDTLEFEETGPGEGRLATHSPPFPGLLARKIAALQTAAQRVDALGSVVTSVADPAKAPVEVGGAVVSLDVPLSEGGKIAGVILSAPFDPGGVRLEPSRPVAGALVVVDALNGNRPAGLLKQGELVVTSDADGHFATFLRPSEQGRPRELLASHPRFPFQTARLPISLAANATAVARVEVVFAELAAGGGTIQGTAKPGVEVSQFPSLPSLGVGENDGAVLTLSAFDDVQVKTLNVEVVSGEDAQGQPIQNAQSLVTLNVLSEVGGQTSRMIRKLKVTAKANLKANLRVTVTDNLDQPVVVNYALHFGFTLSGTVVDPNDNLGPYVSLVWPPPFSERIPSLSPILIRFARPIHPDFFHAPLAGTWIQFEGNTQKVTSIEPAANRREALVYYSGPRDGLVKVKVLPVLKDENGHDFDQNPATSEREPFAWEFTQAGEPNLELADGKMGGGIAMVGGFAYALDRQGGDRGRLISYDLRNPAEPEVFDTRDLSGSPMTLSALPNYSLPKYSVSDAGEVTVDGCETATFLAVFTGSVQEPKRLLVLPARGRVTNPLIGAALQPPVVSAALNEGGVSQIVKSHWDPPFLGYFELGADVTSIHLLNFPAFYLGASLKDRPSVLRKLPRGGVAGVDVNGDGDYCDAGDQAPQPFLDPLHPFGFAFSFAPEDPKERIQDFDFLSGLGLVATVSAFNEAGRTNLFRVVLAATETEPLTAASVGFLPGQRPKRVVLVPKVRLRMDGVSQLKDLALVSVAPESGRDGGLAIIDVTHPAHPTNLFSIPLPPGSGAPGSIQRRTDGKLALATAQAVLLIDPSKLGDASTASGHPAFVGSIDLAAGGVRDFVSEPSGWNAIYSGGTRRIVQSAPQFQLVTFDRSPFQPESLLELPEGTVQTILSKARTVPVVELAKTTAEGEVVPDLSPDRHYYVLVDAPGGDGQQGRRLPLVMAGVDERGQLYDRRAKTPVPVVLGDPSVHRALLLKQLIRLLTVVNDFIERATREVTGREIALTELAQSALNNPDFRDKVLPDLKEFVRLATTFPLSFEARRLSDDPASPLYNRYLAGPVMVLSSGPDLPLLQQLIRQAEQLTLERRYLRASPRIWMGFPSQSAEHPVIGRFASSFRLNPTLTLEGFSVPLVTQLAEQLTDAILGGSDTVAPILLAAVSRFTPVQTDFKPTLLPGASLLLPVAYKDRPLVFVPGFAGSRLRQQGGEVWPGFLSGVAKTNLAMRPDGVSVFPTTPADALRHVLEIRRLNLGVTEVDDVGFGDIYAGMIKFLIRSQGYVEYDYFNPAQPDDPFKSYQEQRRRLNGAPILTNSPAPDLFVFAYDWRRDSTIAANQLEQYIKIAQFYHPDADGIDLVAHSNGNFVAREYMRRHPGVARRYIALGAPWLGSAKPLIGLLTGDMEDLELNFLIPIRDLRRSSQFMPGFHQLIPNRGLFDFGFPVIRESGFDVNRDGQYFGVWKYPQYASALASNLFRATHGEVGFAGPVSPVRANLENLHLPGGSLVIGDGSGDDTTTETHHLFSIQATPRSFAGVRYVGRLHRAAQQLTNVTLDLPALQAVDADEGRDLGLNFGDPDGPLGITTNQFRFRGDIDVIRTLGDGTVPLLSLARGAGAGAGLNYNPRDMRIHCLVSDAAGRDADYFHNPVLNHNTFRRWLEKILEGRVIRHLAVEAASSPAVVSEGDEITLNVTATSPAGEATATAVTQLVDFGDGGTAARAPGSTELPGFRYRYRQNGTYTITVAATTPAAAPGDGARFDPLTGLTSLQIEVRNVAPTVQLSPASPSIALNSTLLFEARVTDPGLDDTHTFAWFLDGHRLPGRESFVAGVNFSELGEHQLRVVATDSDGASGEATTTVRVVPGVPPTGQFAAGRDPARLAADPPRVFARQPELQVRITGVRPGLFGTRGVVVRDQNNRILADVECNLPIVCDVANTFLIASRVLLNSPIDALIQRTSGITLQANLRRRLGADGDTAVESFVEFLGRGGPLEVEALYLEGGVPVRLATWRTNILANRPVSFGIKWDNQDLSLRVDDQSRKVPPDYLADGAAAGDRQPPAVAAIFNPATGNVSLFARDNISQTNKIRMYLVQDTSPDGILDNDVFYELKTNVLVRARLPSRPFAIVAEDEAGNVSPPVPLVLQGASDYTFANPGYCDELETVRTTVRATIQDSLNSEVVNDLFLLQRDHLWVFEQGSGACLWKENSCVECNGNYNPSTSDNDYQLMLPVHLRRNYTTNVTDRAEFLAEGPYEPTTLGGDWYFRRPVGLDEAGVETTDSERIQTWQYLLPAGFENRADGGLLLVPKAPFGNNLALGFPTPMTPAEVIAKAFSDTATNSPARRKVLKEVSFFPVRREHFMYGVMDLELPPGFGSDAIADGGCGRQMLLLKWALEGSFVGVDPGLGVNRGVPTLDLVYGNIRDMGVPIAEGLEWGFLQEYLALDAGVAVNAHATYGHTNNPQVLISGAGNDLVKTQRKKLKKLGKSAIRGALARLAGDPEVAGLVFGVSRQQYLNAHLPSFEDFILRVATNDLAVARRVFGEFATDRAIEDGPDLADFLALKKGEDEGLIQEILRRPEGYSRVVQGGLKFLREVVQTNTEIGYDAYLSRLSSEGHLAERGDRVRNLHLVLEGDGAGRKGLNDYRRAPPMPAVEVVVAANNYTTQDVTNAVVRLTPRAPGPGADGSRPGTRVNRRARLAAPGDPPVELTALNQPPALSGDAEGDDSTEDRLHLATVEGEPVVSELDMEAESTAEGLPAGESTMDDAPVEEVPTPGVPAPIDFGSNVDPKDDNSLDFYVDPVENVGAAPAVREVLEGIFVGLNGNDRLTDHPRNEGRNQQRSPARYLRKNQGLFVRFQGKPNRPEGAYQVKARLGVNGTEVVLAMEEFPTGSGTYQNADPLGVQGTVPPLVRVQDEEILFVEVVEGGQSKGATSVMIDVGEVASFGIDIFYSRTQPFWQSFRSQSGWADAGDRLFANDVGITIGQPGLSDLGKVIASAGLPANGLGEADLLYVTSHGISQGPLIDHATPPKLVFNPATELSGSAFVWGADVEWILLDACSTLAAVGQQNWTQGLLGERPVHGILGAHDKVAGDLRKQLGFFTAALRKFSVIEAYEFGMFFGGDKAQPWAVVLHEAYESEKLSEPMADLIAPGTIRYRKSGLSAGLEPVCGKAVGADLSAILGSEPDAPEPRQALPMEIRLKTGSAWPELTASTQRRQVLGELAVYDGPTAPVSAPIRRSIFDAPQATAAVREMAARALSTPGLDWRVTDAAPETDTTIYRDGREVVSTNNITVHLEQRYEGVRVEGARTMVKVGATGITRVATCFKTLVVEEAPTKPAHRVVPVGVDVARAAVVREALPQTDLGGATAVEWVRSGLLYVPRDRDGHYQLRWRFEFGRPPVDNSERTSQWIADVDAATGALIQVQRN